MGALAGGAGEGLGELGELGKLMELGKLRSWGARGGVEEAGEQEEWLGELVELGEGLGELLEVWWS